MSDVADEDQRVKLASLIDPSVGTG